VHKDIATRMAAPSTSVEPESAAEIRASCKQEIMRFNDPTFEYKLKMAVAIADERFADAARRAAAELPRCLLLPTTAVVRSAAVPQARAAPYTRCTAARSPARQRAARGMAARARAASCQAVTGQRGKARAGRAPPGRGSTAAAQLHGARPLTAARAPRRLRDQVERLLASDRALALVVAIESALEDDRLEARPRARAPCRGWPASDAMRLCCTTCPATGCMRRACLYHSPVRL
jgi:hypothetical protein